MTTASKEDEEARALTAEAALRERELELSLLVDMVPSHLWRLAPDGEPIFFNKRMVDFLALDVGDTEKPGKSRLEAVIDLIHPDDAMAFRDSLGRCLDTGNSFALRYRLRRADGVYRWMSSRAEPMRDEGGRIVQWYGLCHDIDDQVRAEDALRRSERQLQQLVDAVPANLWSTARDGTPTYRNKRHTNATGAALQGHTTFDGYSSPLANMAHPEDLAEAERVRARAYATGDTYFVRYRQIRSDGTYRWTESRGEPLRDESGEILQWYGVSVDIHDLVTAQEAVRRSEQELSQLVNMLPVHIRRLSPEGETIFFNKRLVDFIGLDLAELDTRGMSGLAGTLQTLIHPEDAPRLQRTIKHSLTTGDSYATRYRVRRADGVYRWMEGRGEPLRDQNGATVQWYGISIDIDDEVRAQTALGESERRLQQLVDAVPSMIWSTTPDGTPTYLNKRYTDVTGATLEDLRGPDGAPAPLNVVHPDDRDMAAQARARAFATGSTYVVRYRQIRRGGIYRWTETRAEPLRDESGIILQWYGVSVDIDDQVHADDALRRSESRLRLLVDALPAMIWSTTPEGTPSYVNKRFTDVTGANVEDITAPDGSFSRSVIHPDDKAMVAQAVRRSFSTGLPYVIQYRQLRHDGFYRWTETRAEALRDDSGAILQWYGVSVDIDDLLTAQAALRESERALRQLVETLPVMIDCAAPDGEPVYRSQRLREFLGYNLEDLDDSGKSRLAGTLDAGVHPDEVAGVKEQYSYSLSTGEPYARKHRLRRFDGEYRWVETRAAPMRNAENAIVQWNVICLDIEDQVRAEDKLRLAQERLARATQAASLAELSASIAHEVNQPLAAVVANSHACHRWLSAEPPNLDRAKITAERIIRDANSAADVVSRIRALFRQSVEQRSSTAFSSVIEEARTLMAEEAARRRVRMEINVEGNIPLVAFDRVQVQQVLINLIRNGMDSMESASNDRVIGIRVRRMGDVIQTEISDCGLGVEFPDKIFEPFFTTKQQGMGMGLAICRSIVESHGGRLWVEQNEPHGATFVFTLPVEMTAVS